MRGDEHRGIPGALRCAALMSTLGTLVFGGGAIAFGLGIILRFNSSMSANCGANSRLSDLLVACAVLSLLFGLFLCCSLFCVSRALRIEDAADAESPARE